MIKTIITPPKPSRIVNNGVKGLATDLGVFLEMIFGATLAKLTASRANASAFLYCFLSNSSFACVNFKSAFEMSFPNFLALAISSVA